MSTTAAPARVEIADVSVSSDHFIGGERVGSDERFVDISPIDQRVLAEVSRGGAEEADRAVRAAHDAFPAWAALGAAGRADYLRRLADLIDANVDRLAALECEDMAMLLRSLKARVIARGARNYRSYADLAVAYEERDWRSNGTWNRVQRMPAGPAVVITPWNAPFMLSTWKTAPALAAGCTVVLKPAEWSPLSCSLLADLVAEAGFPPGVFNLVQGIGEEVGAALVAHPLVRRVSFTGSPETARLIGVAAANNIVPFTGELGGKSPFLVFATPTSTRRRGRRPASTTTPARCASPEPASWSQEAVSADFLERFNPFADEHVLGDPRVDATTVSPLIHPDHLARVEGFVERAREAGDRIVRGGRRAGAAASGTSRRSSSRARTTPRSSSGRSSARCSTSRRSGTRPRPSSWPTRPSTASPRSSTRAPRAAPSASAGPCAAARCGSTASSSAT